MKGRKSWAMAYCGMAAALSIAFMLLGAVIPIFMYIAPAIASFLVATVCVECGKTLAWTAYGAVSLLSLLFVPDKEVALTFVFLLGYYPLVKPKFEHIRPALLRGLCKLLLCNGGILLLYGLVLRIFAPAEIYSLSVNPAFCPNPFSSNTVKPPAVSFFTTEGTRATLVSSAFCSFIEPIIIKKPLF